ncbi:hypothetical protein HYV10_00990 [Candidatus Dependentiae bacterium]|nr:hypothetical protein [Candidatus Dependentiae bacterium]
MAKPISSDLSNKDIKYWAAKAMDKMVGPMGEFAARNYLKEQGITKKVDLDAIIDQIIEKNKASLKKSSPDIKPSVKKDSSVQREDKKGAEVSLEVEQWAEKLKHLDPTTMTYKIIKTLQGENVDKFLYDPIMRRIRQIRLEGKSDINKAIELLPFETKGVSDSQTKEVSVQTIDDLAKNLSIEKIINLFIQQDDILYSFIKIMAFKISKGLDILWQDLIVYFYFTQLSRPLEEGRVQSAYDWALSHKQNEIYD